MCVGGSEWMGRKVKEGKGMGTEGIEMGNEKAERDGK